MIRCAEAHSQSKTLAEAIREPILAKPRIHLGVGPEGRPFPNKCRHCEPAPCQDACMGHAPFLSPDPASVHRCPANRERGTSPFSRSARRLRAGCAWPRGLFVFEQRLHLPHLALGQPLGHKHLAALRTAGQDDMPKARPTPRFFSGVEAFFACSKAA